MILYLLKVFLATCAVLFTFSGYVQVTHSIAAKGLFSTALITFQRGAEVTSWTWEKTSQLSQIYYWAHSAYHYWFKPVPEPPSHPRVEPAADTSWKEDDPRNKKPRRDISDEELEARVAAEVHRRAMKDREESPPVPLDSFASAPVTDLDHENIIVSDDDDDDFTPRTAADLPRLESEKVGGTLPFPYPPSDGEASGSSTAISSRVEPLNVSAREVKDLPPSLFVGPSAQELPFPSWDKPHAAEMDDAIEWMFTPYDFGSSPEDNTGLLRKQCVMPYVRTHKSKAVNGWLNNIYDYIRYKLHSFATAWRAWSICDKTVAAAADFSEALRIAFSFTNVVCVLTRVFFGVSWLMGLNWILFLLLICYYVFLRVTNCNVFWLFGLFWLPLIIFFAPVVLWFFLICQLASTLWWVAQVYVFAGLADSFPLLKFRVFAEAEPPILVTGACLFGAFASFVGKLFAFVFNMAWSFSEAVLSTIGVEWLSVSLVAGPSFWWYCKGFVVDSALSAAARWSSTLKVDCGDKAKKLNDGGRKMLEQLFGNATGWKDLGIVTVSPAVLKSVKEACKSSDTSKHPSALFERNNSLHADASSINDDMGVWCFFSNGRKRSDPIRVPLSFFPACVIGGFSPSDSNLVKYYGNWTAASPSASGSGALVVAGTKQE